MDEPVMTEPRAPEGRSYGCLLPGFILAGSLGGCLYLIQEIIDLFG
jgi:hypothetical protein